MLKSIIISITITIFVITFYFINISLSNNRGFHSFDSSILKNGDIIFIHGKSWRSIIVNLLDKKNRNFSHLGIVKINDENFCVIHSTPTPPDKLNGGKVIIESISKFLLTDNVSEAVIYRLKNDVNEISKLAASIAQKYADSSIPFDNNFCFSSDDSLYCTELVWKAYKNAGLDLIDLSTDQLIHFIKSDKILWPSMIVNSPYLQEVKILDY